MYINDLPLSARHCDFELYAEDTLLFFASNDTNTIEAKMISDLENVIQWLHSNFLVLNLGRTKIMLVGTHQRLATAQDFKIKANEVNIERVDHFKYLGDLMDQNLSWNDHTSYIGWKIASRLGMLRRARQVLPRSACTTLYNAMILPLFDFCAEVWDSCGIGNKNYLDKLNRRAASIIEHRSVEASELRTVLVWPSLQARRNYLKCLMVFKSLHTLAPSYLLTEFRHACEIHQYNTRHCDLLRLPVAKTTKCQGSFRYNGTSTFNSLPASVRSLRELAEFKRLAKRYFKVAPYIFNS